MFLMKRLTTIVESSTCSHTNIHTQIARGHTHKPELLLIFPFNTQRQRQQCSSLSTTLQCYSMTAKLLQVPVYILAQNLGPACLIQGISQDCNQHLYVHKHKYTHTGYRKMIRQCLKQQHNQETICKFSVSDNGVTFLSSTLRNTKKLLLKVYFGFSH